MASIGSLTGSSSSSIYGTRNVISGLASGLDTEALIENAVSGYKNKITSLQQQRTKVGWQQDAYRSMINKMVSFTQKYTSYTSSTNLLSSTFFDSAVNVKALGDNAGKVSASGKTSSNVVLNEVTALAQAARYTTEGALEPSGEAVKAFGLNDTTAVGKLSGSMTLGYGGRTVQISFSEADIFKDAQAMADAINKKLEEETVAFDGGSQAKASERIKAVVDGDSIKFETVDEKDGNGIWISDASASIKNALDIEFPKDDKEKKSVNSFDFKSNIGSIVDTNKTMLQLIKDKGFAVTVNGSSQTIKITDKDIADADGADNEEKLINALNSKLDSKDVEFYDAKDGAGVQIGFRIKDGVDKNNVTFQVTSAAAEQLGMEGGLTSYVNTNRKLEDLLNVSDDTWNQWRSKITVDDPSKLKETDKKDIYKTADGLYVKKENGVYYQTNSVGEYYYDIKINGKSAAIVTKETTMDELLNRINNSDTSEINASYSKFTGKFTFTAKESGKNSEVNFDGLMGTLFYTGVGEVKAGDRIQSLLDETKYQNGAHGQEFSIMVDGQKASITINGPNPNMKEIADALTARGAFENGRKLGDDGYRVAYDDVSGKLMVTKSVNNTTENVDITYGDGIATDLINAIAEKNGYTAGQDAEFTVTVNGVRMSGLKRNTNTIDIDGMSLTLKGTFAEEEGKEITFQTEADSDKIVDAVKQMVNDFNTLAKEVKDAYSTIPLQRSNGKYYEPLTEEDQAEMSESAIKAYEEKAKTGLLFADRDLSSLYDGLRNALSQLGVSGNDATKLGITASYSDGLTTISLDESALRNALNSNPDKVKDLFTKSKSNGSSSDGLMQGIKNVMDKYAGTTGSVKGILVEKAGSPLAPTSIYKNAIQTQLDNLDKQIEKWQDRISDQIDYYTTKFTALEKMMAQMNDQSSMLMGFAGGY